MLIGSLKTIFMPPLSYLQCGLKMAVRSLKKQDRRSNWWFYWTGLYFCNRGCVCQNLQKTKPWLWLCAPSTANGRYHFKYVNMFFKFKGLKYICLFNRLSSRLLQIFTLDLIIYMSHCYKISDTHQGYSQPLVLAYSYPQPTLLSGQQVISHKG